MQAAFVAANQNHKRRHYHIEISSRCRQQDYTAFVSTNRPEAAYYAQLHRLYAVPSQALSGGRQRKDPVDPTSCRDSDKARVAPVIRLITSVTGNMLRDRCITEGCLEYLYIAYAARMKIEMMIPVSTVKALASHL
jgi:hypothetical protein